MRISLASDHGGFQLKEVVKEYLQDLGHQVLDRGTHSEESCDYPDYGFEAVKDVLSGVSDRAVLICGTGLGMSILANRFKGIRATLCFNEYMARMSRLHNNSNILVLGGRVIGAEVAKGIVDVWLNTPFEGGRHERRLSKLERLGGEYKG